MSRRARSRADKRANAFALHRSDDAPFQMPNGGTYDPRDPWQFPGRDEQPHEPDERQPPPVDRRIPIGPLDVAAPQL